jgi:2'-5' RNA ligase
VPHQRWYWGVVVRVDGAEPILRGVAGLAGDDEALRAQDARTGHVTLLYAPLRGRRAADDLSATLAPLAEATAPFEIAIGGLGEFASDERTVAWLGVDDADGALGRLRDTLCRTTRDDLPHRFVPHLTLLYGEDPAAYARLREPLHDLTRGASVRATVDAIWIAGFPQGGHPARDLRYAGRLPLSGTA